MALSLSQEYLDAVGSPGGHTASEEIGIFCPDRASQGQSSGQNRPVIRVPRFQPLASLIARRQEFEADAFAAAHASASDLVSALAKLYRDNASTLTPDPLHSLVYESHPPAALRIDHLRRGREAP